MRKKRGIFNKIIIGVIALAVIGAVFGNSDKSPAEQSTSGVKQEEAAAQNSVEERLAKLTADTAETQEKPEIQAQPEVKAEESGTEVQQETTAEEPKTEAPQQETKTEEPITEVQQPEVKTEEPPKTEEPKAEPQQPAQEPEKTESNIRPELKAFLDSYESFIDEYCKFMENYNASDITMLMKYTEVLSKYADFAEKADAWKSKDMNNAELIYYTEVMNRVSVKLLKVSQNL